jgi:hypothetical protein
MRIKINMIRTIMEATCWNLCERNTCGYWTQEITHILRLEKGNPLLISETGVFPYGGKNPPPYSMEQSLS